MDGIIRILEVANSASPRLLFWLLNASWQAGILIGIIWLGLRIFRIKSAPVRFYLWLFALLGVALLPVISPSLPHLRPLWVLQRPPEMPPMELVEFPPPLVSEITSEGGDYEPTPLEERIEFKPPEVVPIEIMPTKESPWPKIKEYWPLALAGAWILGTVFFLARLLRGHLAIRRLKRNAREVKSASALEIASETAARIGLKRNVRLLASSDVNQPATAGIFRPVVILPDEFIKSAGADEIRPILIHEFAHIRRRDFLINLFQRLLEAAFFFHPLIWIASRNLRLTREEICDNWVLEITGEGKSYARSLAKFAEAVSVRRVPATVALIHRRPEILRRIEMILDEKRKIATRLSKKAACFILLLAAFTLPLISAFPFVGEAPAAVEIEGVEDEATTSSASEAEPRGYALSFDGVDDYLEVADSSSLRLDVPFTVEIWVRPGPPLEKLNHVLRRAVLAKSSYGPDRKARGVGLTLDFFPKRPTQFMLSVYTAKDGSFYEPCWGYWSSSRWMHLAVVFDKDKVKVFVNGAPHGTSELKPAHYEPGYGSSFIIGNDPIRKVLPFKGQIRGLRIWNHARPGSDIERDMMSPLAGDEPGLIACWTFSEGSGQLAHDISPNHNDARLGTSPAPDDADPKWITSSHSDKASPASEAEEVAREPEKAVSPQDAAERPVGYEVVAVKGRVVVEKGKPVVRLVAIGNLKTGKTVDANGNEIDAAAIGLKVPRAGELDNSLVVWLDIPGGDRKSIVSHWLADPESAKRLGGGGSIWRDIYKTADGSTVCRATTKMEMPPASWWPLQLRARVATGNWQLVGRPILVAAYEQLVSTHEMPYPLSPLEAIVVPGLNQADDDVRLSLMVPKSAWRQWVFWARGQRKDGQMIEPTAWNPGTEVVPLLSFRFERTKLSELELILVERRRWHEVALDIPKISDLTETPGERSDELLNLGTLELKVHKPLKAAETLQAKPEPKAEVKLEEILKGIELRQAKIKSGRIELVESAIFNGEKHDYEHMSRYIFSGEKRFCEVREKERERSREAL